MAYRMGGLAADYNAPPFVFQNDFWHHVTIYTVVTPKSSPCPTL